MRKYQDTIDLKALAQPISTLQPLPTGTTRPAPLLFDGEHQPIASADAWKPRRYALEGLWRDFLGAIPVPAEAPSPRRLHEERLPADETGPAVRRVLVEFEAEPDGVVKAYWLEPEAEAPPRSRPGVVVLHSTVDYTIRQPAGLEGPPEKHIGLQLARRGAVALCPENYLWGHGSPKKLTDAVDWLRARHPEVTGMEKMLFDSRRTVDLLASMPTVDPNRLGAIGHSLGGKEVLYLAAFDPRIRAAVSSEGGIGLTYSNWDAPWYLGDAIRRPGFPLDHGQVLALAAPRAFLLIGGESADGDWSVPYIEAARPVWNLLGAPEALGFFNHRQGHAYPPVARDTALAWLDHHLGGLGRSTAP